jgi:formylglycine-generating enzyme required for sulfatase activity
MNGGDHSLAKRLPAWSRGIEKAQRNGEAGARLVDCDDRSPFTSVVGRYGPNPYGLLDVIGNAWEWVEDCWSQTLPVDTRPQTTAVCTDHRTRGGSWDDYPDDLRTAVRKRLAADTRRNDVGFRLVSTP